MTLTMLKFCSIPFLLILFSRAILAPDPQADKLIDDGHSPYQHVQILDPEGKYKLEWVVDWYGGQVIFNLNVETLGFVAFGLSRDDTRKNPHTGIDYVIGGVDYKGELYFDDMAALGNDIPVVDYEQDWNLISARQTWTHTYLSFSRPFVTGDPQDVPINDDTLILVWAYGETDYPYESWEDAKRGVVPMYLLDPDLTPLVIQEGEGDASLLEGGDLQKWSIPVRLEIPKKRTTYWCRIHKLDLPSKRHIVGWTMTINDETKSNIHHMLLFRCTLPNPASLYEQYVDHPGEECYTQEEQLGEIPFLSCLELKAGYAIGGRPAFFPGSLGFPVGESGGPDYFLLQTHYDNPKGRVGLMSEARLDIYYTAQLRPHDGGIMSVGHHIPGSPSILLPPGSVNHLIHGGCSPGCTTRILPRDGIRVTAAHLHAHNAGRRITIQHIRNDVELPRILDDRNWKLDFQPIRLLRNEVRVLPGDQLRIRCSYSTTYTNRTVVGGYGSDQEMCKIFIFYYNNIPDYSICRSELISREYTARYLAGTEQVVWNQTRLEFMATEPEFLYGLTLSEISDEYVDWTIKLREWLQSDHELLPQIPICPTMEEIQAYASREGITPHCKALQLSDYFGEAPWCRTRAGLD